jgi:hypothetical protein
LPNSVRCTLHRRQGGELSERQWADITGLLRVNSTLDDGYLLDGARELGVADLLGRALDEAGPRG